MKKYYRFGSISPKVAQRILFRFFSDSIHPPFLPLIKYVGNIFGGNYMTSNIVDVPTRSLFYIFSVSSRRQELQLPYPSIIFQQQQYALNAN